MSAATEGAPISNDSKSEEPTRFSDFELAPELLAAVEALGFEEPTDIQAATIPHLLQGRDVLGQARTGSGKTASFGLPLLHMVRKGGTHVQALVLAPTRELALQVCDALEQLRGRLPIRILPIYGGASYGPQVHALREGVSVVVATPGRLIDHIEKGRLDLSKLDMLVLDEADEMLRMGFLDEVERVFDEAPQGVQVVLFSATMPKPIQRVANKRLTDPVQIRLEGKALSADHIQQRWMKVPQQHKLEALERLIAAEKHEGTLVFARTRQGCAELADALGRSGIRADAMHGDLNQVARERVLEKLRDGRLRVLVATDVAARGLDVDTLTHVVNMDLPRDAEIYVHRIGRTGRAGRDGLATTLVTPREQGKLGRLQKALGKDLEFLPVPSDAAIAARRRADLLGALEEVDPAAAKRWLHEQDLDVEDIAARALTLLAARERVPLAVDLDDNPPEWAKPPRPPRAKPDRAVRRDSGRDDDHVELFFPMGRKHGVRPGDLVGALTNECGLPGHLIGRITIVEFKSFVGLPRAVAEQVLEQGSIEVRGREVPLTLSRSAPQTGRPRPFKGPRKKFTPGRR